MPGRNVRGETVPLCVLHFNARGRKYDFQSLPAKIHIFLIHKVKVNYMLE
jgi:hypothetical protein